MKISGTTLQVTVIYGTVSARSFFAAHEKERKAVPLCGSNVLSGQLLSAFEITQPTLSHHMKILCDTGLGFGRQDVCRRAGASLRKRLSVFWKTLGCKQFCLAIWAECDRIALQN